MAKWEKLDSYAPGRDASWQARLGSFRVTVTRHIDYPPDVWTMIWTGQPSCRFELAAKDIKHAKTEALENVLSTLTEEATNACKELISG